MRTVAEIDDVRREVGQARQRGETVGFVPTMGALHAGHGKLIETARRECGFVVVSIFVNPTQFGPNEDFTRYPRTLEADESLCRTSGCDLIFHPAPATIYPSGFCTSVELEGPATLLEGAHRPGHFRGVATVVLKLLQIVACDVAYFGQKDYQQQLLVRRMCRDLNVPVEIRSCPTVREPDGLAMSSRNRYLSAEERGRALSLWRALQTASQQIQSGATDLASVRAAMRALLENEGGAKVDYATIADPETLIELDAVQPRMVALIAARIGSTRLIDNLEIQAPPG